MFRYLARKSGGKMEAQVLPNYKLIPTEYRFDEDREMNGVKRVLIFCTLIVILPATLIVIPLYLRRTVFADVVYPVAESDIIEIRDGISSIFCQQHSLKMSSNFNAFQLSSKPEISSNHKHIRLKKSMTLPDDTFEYWGFYLLKGARVLLKFCSRYEGARMLVVKGARELDTCGLLDHNKNKLGPNYPQNHEQVKVFFEDITEIHEPLTNNMSETTEAAIAPQGPVPENLMEMENDGGEDLSEDYEYDLDEDESTSPTTTTTTSSTTTTTTKAPHTHKPRGKKLKKGTYKTTEHNGNSLVSKEEEHKTMEPEETNIRSRRSHRTHGHAEAGHSHRHDEDTERERRKRQIYDKLFKSRRKRDHVYDRKYTHGGNAMNFTETDESNSISSFETGLLECFKTNKLSFGNFPPIAECTNPHFLENGSHRMLSIHEIDADGYYYYIFYSDNDLVRNDIHAIFDIYKPTFQYSNISNSQGCVNATNCTFSIGFLSDEIVVVEVPTRDGIEHEEDDITYLISTCHPRTEIYAIFPILVLILILSCSFL
uniref:E3 ubiquitin-protein ligase APD1-4 middle domain-containing protein n=2 Tax=Musca domestica TaxID=7370 RepID=A0A1I8MR76_MUSDO